MSDVGDINHIPAVRPVRPQESGTKRRHIPEQPEREKKHQPPPEPDDDGETHVDEYA